MRSKQDDLPPYRPVSLSENPSLERPVPSQNASNRGSTSSSTVVQENRTEDRTKTRIGALSADERCSPAILNLLRTSDVGRLVPREADDEETASTPFKAANEGESEAPERSIEEILALRTTWATQYEDRVREGVRHIVRPMKPVEAAEWLRRAYAPECEKTIATHCIRKLPVASRLLR